MSFRNPAFLKLTPFVLLRATLESWVEDKALRLSAAVAYYSIFSIAPLLILSISLAGVVFGEEAVKGHLQSQLINYVGEPAATAVQSMVKSAARAEQGFIATVLGFVTLLLGATGVFGQLKDALNTIWEVRVKPGKAWLQWLRERVVSFGMVLVIGFLLLTSLLLTTAMAGLHEYLETVYPVPGFFWTGVSLLTSFGFVTVLFAFIFKVLPDAIIAWRDVWAGAIFTSALFEIGKLGLSLYLGRESTVSSYGAAGAVVLLLLWVYYNACILFLGAEFTQIYTLHTGRRIRPAPGAELIETQDRLQQGLAPATHRILVEEDGLPKPPSN
ncbi:membrane protein [Prosthecobacter fusiformis]|uniref:Membrane protein n=1 Tax=Prosthecobacter fusiformis TaxID=48464 RepID=A0A4R7RVM4_9BACT|nr:YihY/virulence factor BrkB family protein [Prosthecobacter fusiformis]TDU69319.1 membrane protein [Prosthecobacter fusiformis]